MVRCCANRKRGQPATRGVNVDAVVLDGKSPLVRVLVPADPYVYLVLFNERLQDRAGLVGAGVFVVFAPVVETEMSEDDYPVDVGVLPRRSEIRVEPIVTGFSRLDLPRELIIVVLAEVQRDDVYVANVERVPQLRELVAVAPVSDKRAKLVWRPPGEG